MAAKSGSGGGAGGCKVTVENASMENFGVIYLIEIFFYMLLSGKFYSLSIAVRLLLSR